MAVLCLPTGEERVCSWWNEYGDGDGRKNAADFIAQCERQGVLRDGESLRSFVFHVPLEVEIHRLPAKHCRICRRWLPLDSFGDDLSRWDFKASACRSCKNARERFLWASR